jgi:hypothetical protein
MGQGFSKLPENFMNRLTTFNSLMQSEQHFLLGLPARRFEHLQRLELLERIPEAKTTKMF